MVIACSTIDSNSPSRVVVKACLTYGQRVISRAPL